MGHRLRLLRAAILVLVAGCSRGHYRRSADCETAGILQEKTLGTPWNLPSHFTIEPEPASRLFDPTESGAPSLPPAGPRLHTYQLPSPSPQERSPEAGDLRSANDSKQSTPSGASEAALPVVPLPVSAWQNVPLDCLTRMSEFDSVREEYRLTHGSDPGEELRDSSPRLSLEDIVQVALLNSREYQTQKEMLYRAALALTLERFDYSLKFAPTGNGTALNFDDTHTAGHTTEILGIASGVQINKMLATGGDFLARFANDVVLTFGGPRGFTADVSSELFFNFSQSVFQRDIRLEPLIQSERNVVYAGRNFARFRKTFFFQRASEYYAIIRIYRQIEIESQNYFSLVRTLNQAEAEEIAGLKSRIQVEQIEQSMLQGRSRLITTCNNLERTVDRLKISMGLPTEMHINLDLGELNELTQRDKVEVAAERLRRAYRRLETMSNRKPSDRSELLNPAIVLVERLLQWMRLRELPGQEIPQLDRLVEMHARLRVDETRLDVDRNRQKLQEVRQVTKPDSTILLLRITKLADSLLELVNRQLEAAGKLYQDADRVSTMKGKYETLKKRAAQVQQDFGSALEKGDLVQLPKLLGDAEQILGECDTLLDSVDQLLGVPAEKLTSEQTLKQTQEQVDSLVSETHELLETAEGGLDPLAIDVDDAMITALAQRLDLMNERGALADDWRAIKLTADDLKSVLNLNAAETIDTEKNRPFGFTLDQSRTRLGLSLDLPLNRKAQRNAFRRALIDYQAALRVLAEREDTIKLAVRDEIRDFALARVQYLISVASAALAAERVQSTQLELALGFPGVAARDFLEAQDAYRDALGRVADNNVSYLVNRVRFFLDLELMQLNDSGFWPELHHKHFQPTPRPEFPPDAGPAYGSIPEFLRVSREIQQMFQCNP